jgi:hypothetical protein
MIINPVPRVRCLSGEFLNYHLLSSAIPLTGKAVKDSAVRSSFLPRAAGACWEFQQMGGHRFL